MKRSKFGPRLKELRIKANLTQKELAKLAGFTHQAIAHWEQEIGQPKFFNVCKLADALQIPCDEFAKPAKTLFKKKRGRPVR